MSTKELVNGSLVSFPTRDGLILHGFLTGPRNAKKCMIYVHGMTGNFYHMGLPTIIGEKIARLGVAFFAINTRGHDAVAVIRSKRGRRKDHLTAGTDLERFEDSALDIDAAISRMKQLGYRKFILAGHSTGCQKIAYYQYKKKSRDVIGLLLLGAADDYVIHRKELGRGFNSTVEFAKNMVKNGKGDEPDRRIPSHFSPRRFLSLADLRNIEARIFYYDGELKEFSRIKTPICSIFGRKEEYADRPVIDYQRILRRKTNSVDFVAGVIDGTGHSFRGKEEEVSRFAAGWIASLGRHKLPRREIIEINSKFPLALSRYL